MKKIVFGATLIIGSMLSITGLLVGSMANNMIINEDSSVFSTLKFYGVLPIFYILICMLVVE